MNNTPDIINYQSHLHLSERMVIDMTGRSAEYFRKHRGDKNLKSYQWTALNGTWYCQFNTIPNHQKLADERTLALMAEHVEDRTEKSFKEIFKHESEEAMPDYTHYYMHKAPVKLDLDRAKELCVAFGVTVTAREYDQQKKHKEAGVSKSQMWDAMREVANEICPFTFKMKNPISFQNKVKRLPEGREELRDALIGKRWGNQNTRKVGREENLIVNKETGEVYPWDIHQVLIFKFWMNPYRANKLTKAQVYRSYQEECERRDIEPIGETTVKSYINKNRMWMSLERDGRDHFSSKYMPYIPQKKNQYSGTQWAADFSGLKLLYNDNGKARSPYMLRIVDTGSEKIVGWALTDGAENWQTVLQALEMAIENNGGHSAFELVTDNGGAFKAKEVITRLRKLFGKHRPINLGNKQANPAEMYVKQLSDFSRRFDNWSMLGFASSFKNIDAVANPDRQELKDLPTKGEVYQQAAELVEMWNNEERPSGKIPNKYHEENRHPELQPVNAECLRFGFGRHTTIAFASARSILSVRYQDAFLKFHVAEWDKTLELAAKHSTDKNLTVAMTYNTEGADLYSLEGKWFAHLKPVELSHKSYAEATDESRQAYRNHKNLKKDYEAAANLRTDDLVEATEAVEIPYGQSAKLNGNAKVNSRALEDGEDDDLDLNEFQLHNY